MLGKRFRQERFNDWKYWFRRSKNGGVSGNSRSLPHRYLDEGDNGPTHRREVRRKETRLWRRELDHTLDEEYPEDP